MIGKENNPCFVPIVPIVHIVPIVLIETMEHGRSRTLNAGYVPMHAIQGQWSSKKKARKFAVKYLQKFAGRVAQLRMCHPTDIVGQFEKQQKVRNLVAKVSHALPPILSGDKIIINKCKTLLEGVMMTYFPGQVPRTCTARTGTAYKMFIESKVYKQDKRLVNVKQHVATVVKNNMVKYYFFINIINDRYAREYMDKLLVKDLIANGDQSNANMVRNLNSEEMEQWFPTFDLLPNSLPDMVLEQLLVQVCPYEPMQEQFDHLLQIALQQYSVTNNVSFLV
tara:strand:+ start:65 stop:904 length:840 start_codon:yes stop_codon:yes gene_type:complete